MAATRKPRWIDPFEERQIRRLVAESRTSRVAARRISLEDITQIEPQSKNLWEKNTTTR